MDKLAAPSKVSKVNFLFGGALRGVEKSLRCALTPSGESALGDLETSVMGTNEEQSWRNGVDSKLARLEEGQRRLEEWQERADGRFQRLEEGLMRNNDILGIVIERIDHIEAERQRSEAEQRRYFEILIEQTRWDRSAQGEGIKANRERLDDHESRITNLEAS